MNVNISECHQSVSFMAVRWSIEWWIFPNTEVSKSIAERSDLLAPKALPIDSPPIDWSFFRWTEVTNPAFFALTTRFREELKTAIRKRSHWKGNLKNLSFRQAGRLFPFEPYVILYLDHSAAIYFRTPVLTIPMSSSDLRNLSSHPSLPQSQLRMAVDKICEVLLTETLSARPSASQNYSWYPYIHIFDYKTQRSEKGMTDDFPWSDLVPIGTRHPEISSSKNQQLIAGYKAKNSSISGGVLVIDKQSTLVVSEKEYLELQGIRFCLVVALRMRQLLERAYRSGEGLESLSAGHLERLRLAFESPSLISDSHNYRKHWSIIAKECQVIEWLTNLEKKEKVGHVSSTEGQSFSLHVHGDVHGGAQIGPNATQNIRGIEYRDGEPQARRNLLKRPVGDVEVHETQIQQAKEVVGNPSVELPQRPTSGSFVKRLARSIYSSLTKKFV